MKKHLLIVVIFIGMLFAGPAGAQQNEESLYASGIVYHDANRNGILDKNEKGIEGVRVSNGRIITKTNASGRYSIPVSDDTIIFVIKPRNWKTAIDANNVPQFYYIHKPNGSPKLKYQGVEPTGPLPESIDFPLYPNKEPDSFKALFLGDTQPYSEKEIHYLAHDIIEELVGTDASFCVLLGDNVGDDLSLYEPLVPVVGKIGIPAYYVKGNHDSNYDAAPNQKHIDETFERHFGPSYYSFDYGPVHFIAMHNTYFLNSSRYTARLDLNQMAFLRNDLASIPKDQLVVLMMHIPIIEMEDRETILSLLEDHPNTLTIAAHWHTQRHGYITQSIKGWNGPDKHPYLVNVTTCGSWWSGIPDEVGIPHTTMSDGAPNGYSIITFNKNKYSVRFKAARRPDNYQMNIYAPDVVEKDRVAEAEVFVNVFAGSSRSKVEMRIGDEGTWIPMDKIVAEDPIYKQMKDFENSLDSKLFKKTPAPHMNEHMWKANLPKDVAAGTHLIYVRTTDMFNQTYTALRVITIR